MAPMCQSLRSICHFLGSTKSVNFSKIELQKIFHKESRQTVFCKVVALDFSFLMSGRTRLNSIPTRRYAIFKKKKENHNMPILLRPVDPKKPLFFKKFFKDYI